MSNRSDHPILLYDGICGYCNWIVRFIARIDRLERVRFAPLQSGLAKSILDRHQTVRCMDTAVLVEHAGSPYERIYTKWAMTRGLWPHLRGFWKIACRLLALVPLPLGDLLYDLIARYRYRIFGKYETCKLPEAWICRRLADFPEP